MSRLVYAHLAETREIITRLAFRQLDWPYRYRYKTKEYHEPGLSDRKLRQMTERREHIRGYNSIE